MPNIKWENNVDANGNKISNLEDPTSNQDAATKLYTDNKVETLITVSTTAPSTPVVNQLWLDIN